MSEHNLSSSFTSNKSSMTTENSDVEFIIWVNAEVNYWKNEITSYCHKGKNMFPFSNIIMHYNKGNKLSYAGIPLAQCIVEIRNRLLLDSTLKSVENDDEKEYFYLNDQHFSGVSKNFERLQYLNISSANDVNRKHVKQDFHEKAPVQRISSQHPPSLAVAPMMNNTHSPVIIPSRFTPYSVQQPVQHPKLRAYTQAEFDNLCRKIEEKLLSVCLSDGIGNRAIFPIAIIKAEIKVFNETHTNEVNLDKVMQRVFEMNHTIVYDSFRKEVWLIPEYIQHSHEMSVSQNTTNNIRSGSKDFKQMSMLTAAGPQMRGLQSQIPNQMHLDSRTYKYQMSAYDRAPHTNNVNNHLGNTLPPHRISTSAIIQKQIAEAQKSTEENISGQLLKYAIQQLQHDLTVPLHMSSLEKLFYDYYVPQLPPILNIINRDEMFRNIVYLMLADERLRYESEYLGLPAEMLWLNVDVYSIQTSNTKKQTVELTLLQQRELHVLCDIIMNIMLKELVADVSIPYKVVSIYNTLKSSTIDTAVCIPPSLRGLTLVKLLECVVTQLSADSRVRYDKTYNTGKCEVFWLNTSHKDYSLLANSAVIKSAVSTELVPELESQTESVSNVTNDASIVSVAATTTQIRPDLVPSAPSESVK